VFKQKSDTASPAAAPTDPVQQARTRARQRLIGAVVLLVIGIIGFPLVFETQPRPIPVDIPIEIPKRDALPPLAPPSLAAGSSPALVVPASRQRTAQAALPAPKPDAEMITESRSEAGREIAPPPAADSTAPRAQAASAPARAAASAPVRVAASTPVALEPRRVAAAASTPPPVPKPASSATNDGDRARALLEGRPVAAASAEGSRFVVQIGAFADADAARDTRQKAEKLGLKTYTQVAQTPSGNRIRVRIGPFASRADADAAHAKAAAAGLTAVVLTL
jgi:DedD protein